MQQVFESGEPLNFSATNTVKERPMLMGILVASSTAGTIKMADARGTIVNTMSVVAGQYYPTPFKAVGDLVITVGGTLDATLFMVR